MTHELRAAKTWFQKHPRVAVVFHRSWDEMTPAAREIMSSPRDVKIVGTRAVFSPFQSELGLRTDKEQSHVDEDDQLSIIDCRGHVIVTYRGISCK